MRPDNDVFGHALLDWAMGSVELEVLEREDGFTQFGAGPEVYLSGVKGWPVAERRSLRYLRGHVLDVGCGAGRLAVELQNRGVDVVGLDSSPLASKAAQLRGVNEVWTMALEEMDARLAAFDCLVLFGNNFGLFETPARARKILSHWAKGTKPDVRIFMESTSAYFGGAPAFTRSYYQRNKALGLSPGMVTLRYHYRHLVGPWFRWLYVSRGELRSILQGTGWRIERVLGDDVREPYVAVLIKDST